MTFARAQVNRKIVVVIVFLAMICCATLLPFNPPANATALPAVGGLSLTLDGKSPLPVIAQAVSTVTTGVVPVSIFGTIDQAAVTLGAPGGSTAVTLGGCSGFFLCTLNAIKDVVITGFVCSPVALILTADTHSCLDSVKNDLSDLATLAAFPIAASIKQMAQVLLAAMQTDSIQWANWLLNDELGGNNTITTPILSCKIAQGTQATSGCKDAWFLGQYAIMRQIALFLLLPLFMLVIIQSILKGSMYLLVRSAFIMLPVAVIGSVVAVFFAQLLLNLSDDFVNMISSYTSSTTAYVAQFQTQIQAIDTTKINYFAIVWMFALFFATIVIYIELLLRQVGVYMAAFFLPLAFSSLVWPSSAHFSKKVFELLIGLIFSKVFIAAAIALGIAAFANNTAVGTGTVPGGANNATTSGIGSLISGTLIFCMAAFAGTKVIAMTPAAMTAAEGRVMPTHNYVQKGQWTNIVMSRSATLKNWANNNRALSRDFSTGASTSGSTAVARTPRPTQQTGQGAAPRPPVPARRVSRWRR